jgi:hypothetical protein
MKKNIFTFSLVMFLSSVLCATEMYVQPKVGLGVSYYSYNALGLSGGLDFAWKVWENDRKAPGKMYAGADLGFQYWLPTRAYKRVYGEWRRHMMTTPVKGYFSYEFKLDKGPLSYAGPFFTAGVSFDVQYDTYKNSSNDVSFGASFATAFGGTLVFNNNWVLKQTFAWGAGLYGWNSFIIEAGYRF